MLHLIFAEYWAIFAIQLNLAIRYNTIVFNALNVSTVLLHVISVILIYFICVRVVRDRIEMTLRVAEKESRINAVDADMEDFLSNISHELRTPVNVVLGMSEIQLKKNPGKEAFSIRQAGNRLAYQIEDIQDYTECKRDSIILEEDIYTCTSLLNDAVIEYRMLENDKKLELIVDIDPKVPLKMRGDSKKLQKIFRHLLENAVKFTRKGGIYVRVYAEDTDYGVNLCIEVKDTGIGIDNKSIAMVGEGMYQVNKKRNRSSGGIGIGLYVVYGFVHSMGGFVKIESAPKSGTTVRVTIPQKVVDNTPSLSLSGDFTGDIIFHSHADKYKVPKVRDFIMSMAANLSSGLKVPVYPAETIRDIEQLREKNDISVIFVGEEEYLDNTGYFEELSKKGLVIAVLADPGFKPVPGSSVIVLPKPLYGYLVTRVINEGYEVGGLDSIDQVSHPNLRGLRALIVDDEPMNLIAAQGLFRDYEMYTDIASSGKEAVEKYKKNDYDIVFMDHMMPEMDGVEAMKLIRAAAKERGKEAVVVALTANAVSGARDMFMKEGFDGFIAKPMNISEFEHVMLRVLARNSANTGGQAS
ncbi:MAG: response regulator [Butyrivibrio sp.]|nr:response regulator [Butyrivibrio sp.]